VEVDYQFVPIVTLIFGSDAGINLTGKTEVMVE
jgi:hypothetical protein